MYKNMNAPALGIRATLSEVVELALLGGFEGINANMPDIGALAEGQGMRYARSIFNSAHLQIGAWPLPVDWQDDDETFAADLDRLAKHAELAAEFDANQTVTAVAPASDERPFRENFEWHCERFRRIADVLAPHGCRLGLAFNASTKAREKRQFEFIRDFDALVQLAGSVGVSNVGVVVDTWHVHVSGGSVEQVRKLKPGQVVSVRVNDAPEGVNPEQMTEEDRLLPGAGEVIDTPAFIRAFDALGYEGPVTPEPSSRTGRQLSREQAARKAGEAMKRLWTAAGLTPSEAEAETDSEPAAVGA